MNKKHDLTDLFIVAGVVFSVTFAVPVLDSLAGFVTSAINKKINGWMLEQQIDQAEAEAAAETINPSPSTTQAIGFQTENNEVDNYGYETF